MQTQTKSTPDQDLAELLTTAYKLSGGNQHATLQTVIGAISTSSELYSYIFERGARYLVAQHAAGQRALIKGGTPLHENGNSDTKRGRASLILLGKDFLDTFITPNQQPIGDCTSEELQQFADTAKKRAEGEGRNFEFYSWVAEKTRPGKTVRECLSERKLKAKFDTIFKGERK